jgi:hypothetical protein
MSHIAFFQKRYCSKTMLTYDPDGCADLTTHFDDPNVSPPDTNIHWPSEDDVSDDTFVQTPFEPEPTELTV